MKKIYLLSLLSTLLVLGCSSQQKPAVAPMRTVSSVVNANKILMITDSHGEGLFGKELVRLIEEARGNISIYAVGGSAPRDWLEGLRGAWGYWEHHTNGANKRSSKPWTPQIDKLLKSVNPDVVVVELGTNLIWNKFTKKEHKEILSLISKINANGSKCIWIGPPGLRLNNSQREKSISDVQNVLMSIPEKDCDVHYSWKTIRYPSSSGDGIHYDGAGKEGKAKTYQWVREAFTFIDSKI
jgi:hypothetical protein